MMMYLLVAVITDNEIAKNNIMSYYNQNDRAEFLNSCKYVDEVIFFEQITEDFLNKYKIDLVVSDKKFNCDFNRLDEYKIPIKLNKMMWIEDNYDLSYKNLNVEFVNEWHKIWEKKGNIDSDNDYLLNGYEQSGYDYKNTFDNINNNLKITKEDNVLEIGYGSHMEKIYQINVIILE